MTQSGLRPQLVSIVPPSPREGSDAHAHPIDQTWTDSSGGHRNMARLAKDIGLFVAAPFVTLVYVSLFPFIGMAMLVQAWRRRKRAG